MEQQSISLDFAVNHKYIKGVTARLGDRHVTLRVYPYINGEPLTEQGTFSLTGTTPSGKKVSQTQTSRTSEYVEFILSNTFVIEAGQYSNVYVQFESADKSKTLTTQDITFEVIKIADISKAQYDYYISTLEKLIEQYNATFNELMNTLEDQASGIRTDLDALRVQVNELMAHLDLIQKQIDELDLDNWKASVLNEAKTYTDTKSSEALASAKSYSDDQLTAKVTELTEKIDTMNDTLNDKIDNLVVYGEWKDVPLNKDYHGSEGTVPQYRIILLGGRKRVEFRGAVGRSGGLPSQQYQHNVSALPAEIVPPQTVQVVGATGQFTKHSRIAVTNEGTLYIGNNSGEDFYYCYLNALTYYVD